MTLFPLRWLKGFQRHSPKNGISLFKPSHHDENNSTYFEKLPRRMLEQTFQKQTCETSSRLKPTKDGVFSIQRGTTLHVQIITTCTWTAQQKIPVESEESYWTP